MLAMPRLRRTCPNIQCTSCTGKGFSPAVGDPFDGGIMGVYELPLSQLSVMFAWTQLDLPRAKLTQMSVYYIPTTRDTGSNGN